jgi:hypothetical protein
MHIATLAPNVKPKVTAAEIEANCPEELAGLGKRIAKRLALADASIARAKKHRAEAGKLIAQAVEACDAGGFNTLRLKFFPKVGQSRAYELAAIATGKKSVEDIRGANRARVARHRAKKKVEDSVTVTESTTADVIPLFPGQDLDQTNGRHHPDHALGHHEGDAEPAMQDSQPPETEKTTTKPAADRDPVAAAIAALNDLSNAKLIGVLRLQLQRIGPDGLRELMRMAIPNPFASLRDMEPNEIGDLVFAKIGKSKKTAKDVAKRLVKLSQPKNINQGAGAKEPGSGQQIYSTLRAEGYLERDSSIGALR